MGFSRKHLTIIEILATIGCGYLLVTHCFVSCGGYGSDGSWKSCDSDTEDQAASDICAAPAFHYTGDFSKDQIEVNCPWNFITTAVCLGCLLASIVYSILFSFNKWPQKTIYLGRSTALGLILSLGLLVTDLINGYRFIDLVNQGKEITGLGSNITLSQFIFYVTTAVFLAIFIINLILIFPALKDSAKRLLPKKKNKTGDLKTPLNTEGKFLS